MSLYALEGQFPFTRPKRTKPVSACQCSSAQIEVHTNMLCQGWTGRIWVSCTEPWPRPSEWLHPRPPCALDLTYALADEWANPQSHAPNLNKKPSPKSGGYYSSHGALHLEWDVQKANMGMMVKYPQTCVFATRLVWLTWDFCTLPKTMNTQGFQKFISDASQKQF